MIYKATISSLIRHSDAGKQGVRVHYSRAEDWKVEYQQVKWNTHVRDRTIDAVSSMIIKTPQWRGKLKKELCDCLILIASIINALRQCMVSNSLDLPYYFLCIFIQGSVLTKRTVEYRKKICVFFHLSILSSAKLIAGISGSWLETPKAWLKSSRPG